MLTALITNDDGVGSPGLVTLAEAAIRAGLDVLVAAPSWDSSGASASITGVQDGGRLLASVQTLPGTDIEAWAVDAAPAMITVAALRGGFGPPPDLVLSGINCGRNTGHSVLHSGTVGAAFTAIQLGTSSLAVSLDSAGPDHWETAGCVAETAIRWLADARPRAVINVNVPDVALADLRGLRQAPLARAGAVQTNITDTGRGYLHVTFDPPGRPAPGTDAALLADGWAVATAVSAVTVAKDVDVSGLESSWSVHPQADPAV
ncbi:MAG: 5'/3'-nucleotidase SurE [Acidimicrobiales bacterium]